MTWRTRSVSDGVGHERGARGPRARPVQSQTTTPRDLPEAPVLAEPNRTPYDLNFRLFGFPVRIHPLFWLGAVLLGGWTFDLGLEYAAIWVAVVFVSILV